MPARLFYTRDISECMYVVYNKLDPWKELNSLHAHPESALACASHLDVAPMPPFTVGVRLPEIQRLHPRHNLRVVLVTLLALVEQLRGARHDTMYDKIMFPSVVVNLSKLTVGART